MGLLISQWSLAPISEVGCSALGLSRVRGATITNSAGPGLFVRRAALVEQGGRPFLERGVPVLNSRIEDSQGPGVLVVDSTLDLINTTISRSAGVGFWDRIFRHSLREHD